MEKMEIGVMLGVGTDPQKGMKKVLDLGLKCCQMGSPGDEWLESPKREEVKQALSESGVRVTTVFVGFKGEDYSDIEAVKRTVGFLDRKARPARVVRAGRVSDFAKFLGVKRVASHIGFIPEDPKDAAYGEMVEVIQNLADTCRKNGQVLALETGQEPAAVLKGFIEDVGRENLRVNFDPANMILYGSGEPLSALELLAPYVDGVHVKDGDWPTEKGKLGTERRLGEGQVNIPAYIAKLKEIGYEGPLTIEREISGPEQVADLRKAIAWLKELRKA